jgi:beta-lactamase class A
MRRLLPCLLACAVSACAGSGSATSTVPSSPLAVGSASAAPTLAATAATSPSPLPTAVVSRELWITTDVAVQRTPGATDTAVVHLGANYPVLATLASATVAGEAWIEVEWKTPSRTGKGWLPASATTADGPRGTATAGIDALDVGLEEYLEALGPRVGVSVRDVTRGTTYGFNANRSYYVASSVKVAIMLTLMSQVEHLGRSLTGHERFLVKAMIENSNNKAADELYLEIGADEGLEAFMSEIGIAGLDAKTAEIGWGYSTITPAAMSALLERLHEGSILDAADRATALHHMRTIEAGQTTGVGDSSPIGATIAMKDGWIDVHDRLGPYVVNSSGIVTVDCETYVISIYTDRDPNYTAGFAIVRRVARVVGERLIPDWEHVSTCLAAAGQF